MTRALAQSSPGAETEIPASVPPTLCSSLSSVAPVVLTLETVPVQVAAQLPYSSSTSSLVIPLATDLMTRALAQSSPGAETEIPASGLPENFITDQPGSLLATLLGESTAGLSGFSPPTSI
ncbi:unnamed protein product [Ilex paraguariensis]|uniref:Uncharacterized protein n=1 Tax=Ilex paraguariensis TaxID=185542 RepID=A0ABC8SNF6_9AQUA